jgi:hypothetical protein
MSNKNGILQDENGNSLFPVTFDYNVYNSSNQSLANIISAISKSKLIIKRNNSTLTTFQNDGVTRTVNISVPDWEFSTGYVYQSWTQSGTDITKSFTIPANSIVTGVTGAGVGGTQYSNGAVWTPIGWTQDGTTVTVRYYRASNDGSPYIYSFVNYITITQAVTLNTDPIYI